MKKKHENLYAIKINPVMLNMMIVISEKGSVVFDVIGSSFI